MEDLFKEVYKLVKQGYGRSVIQRELGLSQKKTENMIKKVRAKYPNLPAASSSRTRELTNDKHQNVHTSPKVNKKNLKKALLKESNLDKVAVLAKEGLGCRRISQLIEIPENTVSQYLNQVVSKPKRITRAMLLEEKLLETDDIYDLCKSMSTNPNGIKQLIAKKEGTFNPAGTLVKKLVSKSCKYSQLKQEFGGKLTLKRAKEVILDNYKDHFIVETKLPDGDLMLTPIKNSALDVEWLSGKLNRNFKYFINEESNYMSVRFDDSLPGDEITIFNLTDIHVGSKAFRKDLLLNIIEHIANDPMSFFVLGGDLLEAVTKQSVGNELDQYEGLNEQAIEVVKLFKPIAYKCLCFVAGNHDRGRTWKPIHFDLAMMISQMLGIPYSFVRTTIDISFRGIEKRISLAHKYGNAITQAQVVQSVNKLSQGLSYKIDCWFSGHNHSAAVTPIEYTTLIPGQGFMQERAYVANGGSFVKYTGTYAEEAGYQSAPQDIVYFKFNDRGDHLADIVPVMSL